MRKFTSVMVMVYCYCIFGCKKVKELSPPLTDSVSFKLEAQNNASSLAENVGFTVSGNKVSALLPSLQDTRTSLAMSFTAGSAVVTVNDVVQVSGVTANDFSNPVVYTATWPDGTTMVDTVTILRYSGLPILYLTTAAPVVSEDVYVTGNIVVDANSQFPQTITNIPLQIKGHGNTSWGMPKKPYRLKFNSKADMLGLPADKDWVIVANYDDKTFLRNALANETGLEFNEPFTPPGRFVDLVMNGSYNGTYYITWEVEIDSNRVNINNIKTSDTTGSKITGGYLLELDQTLGATYYWYTTQGLPMTIKDPSNITTSQLAYIENYVQAAEDALFANNFTDTVNGYAKYLDVDTFIGWYLVNELSKNNDADDWSSIYYYKDKNGLLKMGPVWDFDEAFGNINYSDCQYPQRWWVNKAKWFSRLFQDPAFVAKVQARWSQVRSTIPALYDFIDQNAAYINASAAHNFTVWDILNTYVWPNAVVLGTYPNEVEYLKNWLTQRVAWMDSQYTGN